MSKPLYNLFPARPPYCPMEGCTCLIQSMDADEPYEPGRSIFCIGRADEPVEQTWFGQKHTNDIFLCTWFPRGWERSLINVGDIEIMLKMFLRIYPEINKGQPINPMWMLRTAGWSKEAEQLEKVIKESKMPQGVKE